MAIKHSELIELGFIRKPTDEYIYKFCEHIAYQITAYAESEGSKGFYFSVLVKHGIQQNIQSLTTIESLSAYIAEVKMLYRKNNKVSVAVEPPQDTNEINAKNLIEYGCEKIRDERFVIEIFDSVFMISIYKNGVMLYLKNEPQNYKEAYTMQELDDTLKLMYEKSTENVLDKAAKYVKKWFVNK